MQTSVHFRASYIWALPSHFFWFSCCCNALLNPEVKLIILTSNFGLNPCLCCCFPFCFPWSPACVLYVCLGAHIVLLPFVCKISRWLKLLWWKSLVTPMRAMPNQTWNSCLIFSQAAKKISKGLESWWLLCILRILPNSVHITEFLLYKPLVLLDSLKFFRFL